MRQIIILMIYHCVEGRLEAKLGLGRKEELSLERL